MSSPLPVPPEVVLAAHGIDKSLGRHRILDRLDWTVRRGQIIGLLGLNGAGKSTLLRCVLGLMPVDAGEIDWFGRPLGQDDGRRLHRIGYVPQHFDLFGWMRVQAYLDFTAAFYPRWNPDLCQRLLDAWALDRRQQIARLSTGQRQKLAIIRALAPDPELLVLDEPVASLDPQARRYLLAELSQLMLTPGRTVILSTHITSDLERLEADIVLLRNGRLGHAVPHGELQSRYQRWRLDRPQGWSVPPPVAGGLAVRVEAATLWVMLERPGAGTLQALQQLAAQQHASLREVPLTLEDWFVELA